MGLVIPGPQFSGENVLVWRVTVSMKFDVPSDWEKQHFVTVLLNGLNRIFNAMCFLVLVGIGQRLYTKGIPDKFSTKTTQWFPTYLNLTDDRKFMSLLLAQCSGTSSPVVVISAPCSYLRLTNSAGQFGIAGWAEVSVVYPWSYCDSWRVCRHLWDHRERFPTSADQVPCSP